jgi:hypothetical protein
MTFPRNCGNCLDQVPGKTEKSGQIGRFAGIQPGTGPLLHCGVNSHAVFSQPLKQTLPVWLSRDHESRITGSQGCSYKFSKAI